MTNLINVAQLAVQARADVARAKTLVSAARAAVETAWRADPSTPKDIPNAPDPEWASPETETEAAADLELSRLCGELAEAQNTLHNLEYRATQRTREALRAARQQGRQDWLSRNIEFLKSASQ